MRDEDLLRIDKLESNFSHLERLLEQLNEVVIAQGKNLDRLDKESQRQSRILQTLELDGMNPDEKPPHYQ